MAFTVTNQPYQVKPGYFYVEGGQESLEEKPKTFGSDKFANMSKCIEPDTGAVFFWSEAQNDWIEEFAFKPEE